MSAEKPSVGKISVGRDLTGYLVVGDEASITVGGPGPQPEEPGPPQLGQHNVAKGHSTQYTVAQGDLYVQQPSLRPAEEAKGAEESGSFETATDLASVPRPEPGTGSEWPVAD